MSKMFKMTLMMLMISICMISCGEKAREAGHSSSTEAASKKFVIDIILGTTREGRTSEKIAVLLKQMIDKRSDVIAEIIDLRVYELPFFNEEVFPSKRKSITDPKVQKWSDTINQAKAFIMVVPEYNMGYPGVLKNALDILFKEWNKKPVGFVGYSGGSSGGKSAIGQLKTVVGALEMVAVSTDITIPQAWKAFDESGNFVNKNIEIELNSMIDELVSLCS